MVKSDSVYFNFNYKEPSNKKHDVEYQKITTQTIKKN